MSAQVVVDTSVASFRMRGDTRALLYEAEFAECEPLLPFQVVAEPRYGALLAGWGARRIRHLQQFIARSAVVRYSDELASAWAAVTDHARRAGYRLEAGDAWIAATAIHLGVPLLTHDADFRKLKHPGLTLVCRA